MAKFRPIIDGIYQMPSGSFYRVAAAYRSAVVTQHGEYEGQFFKAGSQLTTFPLKDFAQFAKLVG